MSDPLEALLAQVAGARSPEGRPFVTLSYAQSLDGSIALRPGEALTLSGPASLAMTHRLRAAHNAILVGIGTVLADDPRLTVREAPGPHPRPVVLDSRLRTPPDARLLQGETQPWIAAGPDAAGDRQTRLEAAGASILRIEPNGTGGLNLPDLLDRLAARGVERLMVEGGAHVITSFLASDLVDLLVLTLAPVLAGGVRAVQGRLTSEGGDPPRLVDPTWYVLGDDVVVWGHLGRGAA